MYLKLFKYLAEFRGFEFSSSFTYDPYLKLKATKFSPTDVINI